MIHLAKAASLLQDVLPKRDLSRPWIISVMHLHSSSRSSHTVCEKMLPVWLHKDSDVKRRETTPLLLHCSTSLSVLENTNGPLQLCVVLNEIVSLFLGSPPWLRQVFVSFFIPRLQFAIFKELIWYIDYTCVHHLVSWDPHAWLQLLDAVDIRAVQSGITQLDAHFPVKVSQER